MKENLLKIINHYGVNHQQRKLQEEVFELQEAISIYETVHNWDSEGFFMAIVPDKEHIIEEFADCMVMLEQFKAYYNLDNDKIIEIMKAKIERQLNRIKEEK